MFLKQLGDVKFFSYVGYCRIIAMTTAVKHICYLEGIMQSW